LHRHPRAFFPQLTLRLVKNRLRIVLIVLQEVVSRSYSEVLLFLDVLVKLELIFNIPLSHIRVKLSSSPRVLCPDDVDLVSLVLFLLPSFFLLFLQFFLLQTLCPYLGILDELLIVLVGALNSQVFGVHLGELLQLLAEHKQHLKGVVGAESEAKYRGFAPKTVLVQLNYLVLQAEFTESLVADKDIICVSCKPDIDCLEQELYVKIDIRQGYIDLPDGFHCLDFLLLLLFMHLTRHPVLLLLEEPVLLVSFDRLFRYLSLSLVQEETPKDV
jgi:hypothetical protein